MLRTTLASIQSCLTITSNKNSEVEAIGMKLQLGQTPIDRWMRVSRLPMHTYIMQST